MEINQDIPVIIPIVKAQLPASFMEKIHIPIWFSGLGSAVSGGTVTQAGIMATLLSGVGNTNYAIIFGVATILLLDTICSKNPIYEIAFTLSEVTSSIMLFQIGQNHTAYPADGADAVKWFGFAVVNGALEAISSDGVTKSTQDLATALSAGTLYKVKQQLTATALKTWINGVAKTNKTTNLPTGSLTNQFLPSILSYRTTATLTINVKPFIIEHDL